MTPQITPRILLTRDFLRMGDRKTIARLSGLGQIVRVGHGAYVPVEEWSRMDADARFRTVIRATSLLFPGEGPYSHLSAAALHRMPSPDPWPARAEVLSVADGSRRAVRGLLRHLAPLPQEVDVLDGLSVTLPARTVADVARTARTRVGLVVADHVLSRRDLAVSPDDLRRELEALDGSTGLRRAHQVLDLADGRSGSPGETLSRLCMWTIGAPIPELQVPFTDGSGLIGIVDFWWPEYDLIGEFDGRAKYQRAEYRMGRTPADVVVDEKIREDRLRALGPRVIRWGWVEANDPDAMRRILAAAGLPIGTPHSVSLRVRPGSAA